MFSSSMLFIFASAGCFFNGGSGECNICPFKKVLCNTDEQFEAEKLLSAAGVHDLFPWKKVSEI